jgi:hypothetical protein
MPKFVGNFELRVKFGYAGMVCTPMPYDYMCDDPMRRYYFERVKVSNRFIPLGQGFYMIGTMQAANAGASPAVPKTTVQITNQLNMVSFKVTECFSVLHCFGLDANVYQALMSRYSQTALAFPIQTLTFQAMNGTLWGQTDISLSLTTTPRFVDSIFILFPLNASYKTCYNNPHLTNWALKMGGYGQIPDVATDTWTPKFYELCANAMNMNNDSQSFNKEVARSLTYHVVNDDMSVTGYYSSDLTNFFIGIPVETDHTFQQWQTSNSAITYYFKAKQANSGSFYSSMSSNPLMGFLKDSVLAIQLREGGTPIISLDEYDISSPT